MCLMSGEILPMHSNMHVVIETDLLDNANPSTELPVDKETMLAL